VQYSEDDNVPRPYRPHNYRAPSWSWASVEGRVSYEDCFLPRKSRDRKAQVASIMDAEVRTIDDNSTGQVTTGFVRIRGHLAHCAWEDRKGSLDPAIAADVSEITTEPFCNNNETPAKLIAPSPFFSAIPFDDPEDAVSHSESLYFLTLFVLEEDVRNAVHPHGLVLKRIAQEGEYARLGIFHSSGEEEARSCCSWPEEVITIV
jgi:hypothetical protein